MGDAALRITVENAPRAEDVAVVEEGLYAFNRAAVGPDGYRRLAVFLRDPVNRVVGGLVGSTCWGWLFVHLLWIEAGARGVGHGGRLLDAAEAEARRRGCDRAMLDTHSFQAPGFYRRRGYEVMGELADCPPGHRRLYLTKRLWDPSP